MIKSSCQDGEIWLDEWQRVSVYVDYNMSNSKHYLFLVKAEMN